MAPLVELTIAILPPVIHIGNRLGQSAAVVAVVVGGRSHRILATTAGIQPGSPEAPLYCSAPGHARQS